MKVHVDWASGRRFDGANADGAALVMDASPEFGGGGAGPSPMETVLLALAGCTGIDIVGILAKMHAPLERVRIEVSAERASVHPKVFTAIHIRYQAEGRGLRADQVERAVALSKDTYCSVSAMLGKTAAITYEVVVAGPTAA